jgi:hypothetical protein
MLTLTFSRDRETKNTILFREDGPDTPAIGPLYVQKHALAKLGNPEKLAVVIGDPKEFAGGAS